MTNDKHPPVLAYCTTKSWHLHLHHFITIFSQVIADEWWGASVVVCLEQGADLRMAQLMPLPLTVSCFGKIQIGFTYLVPADLGSPGKRAVKHVCV